MPFANTGARLFAAAAVAIAAACGTDHPTDPGTTPTAVVDRRDGDGSNSRRAAQLEINYMIFSIDHHYMGTHMARLCIARAVHEDLRELCEMNLENQSREIAMLRQWLREWYGLTHEPELTADDRRLLARLSSLQGRDFEVVFMARFSEHHVQIIRRSRPIVDKAVHEELRHLAANVIRMQSEDVKKLLGWLCHWYGRCRND